MVHVMSGFNVAVAHIVLFYFQVIRRVDDEMAVESRTLAAKKTPTPVVDGGSEKILMTVTWYEVDWERKGVVHWEFFYR